MTRKPTIAKTSLVLSARARREKSQQNRTGEKFMPAPGSAEPRHLRLWLTLLLVVGVFALSVVGFGTWNWLHSLHIFASMNTTTAPPPITTLKVGRTALYADLSITVLNAQYATSFSDDAIHTGPAMVRLNMQVANKTNSPIALVYYDIARLLVPTKAPLAPTNVQLATSVQPKASAKGWLDFPVATGAQLSGMKLQLGSIALSETLVVIPMSGAFHPERYEGTHSPQTLVIYYTFEGSTLTYHLNSIDARYSYNGSEVKAGEQFYVLNFTVDNPNGGDVSPGFGFDYIRLVLNGGNRPPIDNTLPHGFKAGAQSVGGHVAFVAPAGMSSLTIGFLLQLVPGQVNYQVNI